MLALKSILRRKCYERTDPRNGQKEEQGWIPFSKRGKGVVMINNPRKKPIRRRAVTSSPNYPDWMKEPDDGFGRIEPRTKLEQTFPDPETNTELDAEGALERQQERRPHTRPRTTSPTIVHESQPRRERSIWYPHEPWRTVSKIQRAVGNRLPPASKLILIDIVCYANIPDRFTGHRDGQACPSQALLALNLGMTDRTVRNHIDRLVELELIKHWRPDRHWTNRYMFIGQRKLDEWAAQYEAEREERHRRRRQSPNSTG